MYVIQDGVYKYANSIFLKIFGYNTPDEIIGKDWRILIYPEDIPIVERSGIQDRMIGNGTSKRYSFRGIKKDGTIIEVEVLSNSSFFEGKPAVIGSAQEITERGKMQQKLEAHVKDLENLNKIMVDRELKIVELKNKVKTLENSDTPTR
jgi:PAS domain S-box-containing protein